MVEFSLSSGSPGEIITITATNFPKHDPLWMMVIYRPGISIELPPTEAKAGPGGSLSAVFVVPAMPSGAYTFLLFSANTFVSTETRFTVVNGEAVAPQPMATRRPTPTPTPTPPVDPAVAGYSPLLALAMSSLPAQYDFVGDGLTSAERELLEVADSRIFDNDAFLDSLWGPKNWPPEVREASVQAIPLLMLEIDIQKKSNSKHLITWELDSLDRVLDGLSIYEGMCTSCYGKRDYNTKDEVLRNFRPIVTDPRHIHREMLMTFAYFAKADGEGILIRSFMDNDPDDLEMLYRRDPLKLRGSNFYTHASFGRSNLSFMSQIALPDGTVESFPTMVYRVIADADSHRDAAERWFAHINRELIHFTGDGENFADLFRPHSQTPYTPEPGYILLVGEAGCPSSTGPTVSALRLLGLKAYHFLSPEKGRRTGAVEIDGQWHYQDGNMPLSQVGVPKCVFFAPLDAVENVQYDEHCGFSGEIEIGRPATGEVIGDKAYIHVVSLVSGTTYLIRGRGSVSGGGTLPRVIISICRDGSWNWDTCSLTSDETEGRASDPVITFTATQSGFHHILVSGRGGATGTYTLEVQ